MPLEELIKCCMAVAPLVFTMMTLIKYCMAVAPLVFTVMTLYCAYLYKILSLGFEADQEIQHSTVALSSIVCCCECFSNPYAQIRLRLD